MHKDEAPLNEHQIANKKLILARIGGVVQVLHEGDFVTVAEGTIFAALGCTATAWDGLRDLMILSKLIRVNNNRVRLTTKGRKLAVALTKESAAHVAATQNDDTQTT